MDFFKLITGGLSSGMDYIIKCIDIAVDGYHNGKTQELQDALHVLNVWAQEAKNPAAHDITDPFKGSRHAAQDLIAKYKK